MQHSTQGRPALDLRTAGRGLLRGRLLSAVSRPLERLLSIDQLNSIYTEIQRGDAGRSFMDRAISALDLDYHVSDRDIQKVPSTGSLIVVSNHPYGGAEAIVLASMLGRIRGDIKVLANSLL